MLTKYNYILFLLQYIFKLHNNVAHLHYIKNKIVTTRD